MIVVCLFVNVVVGEHRIIAGILFIKSMQVQVLQAVRMHPLPCCHVCVIVCLFVPTLQVPVFRGGSVVWLHCVARLRCLVTLFIYIVWFRFLIALFGNVAWLRCLMALIGCVACLRSSLLCLIAALSCVA